MSNFKRLQTNQYILYTLLTAKPKLSKAIIKNADPELIHSLCEIVHNILNGNVQLNKTLKRKLKRYKKELRRIVCPKRSVNIKRRIFVQKGAGFIPLILGSVLSGIASSIADKYFKK